MSVDELTAQAERARQDYEALVAKGLKLDLTRGKPSPKQLDAANGVLELSGEPVAADGSDLRNYGGLHGLPEVRAIFAEDLQVPVDQLLAAGNSSLELMHDAVVFALLGKVPGAEQRWADVEGLAFLCPVPGYDRHFGICERYGVTYNPADYWRDSSLPAGYVSGWVGGHAIQATHPTIYVGCSPEGAISS